MPYTPPAHTPSQWSDSPSTATPLDKAHLEAAETDLVAFVQSGLTSLDTYLEGLITSGDVIPANVPRGVAPSATPGQVPLSTGDGTNGYSWGAGGAGAPAALFVDITQAPYNVSTIAADNSAAINSALQTLGAVGKYAFLPPGVYPIQNPIIIGNGTSGSASTWNAGLIGGGFPLQPSVTGAIGPTIETKLLWTGTAAAGALGMVQILGPVIGWHIEKIKFDGGVTAANAPLWGLHTRSSVHGRMDRVVFTNCVNGIWHDSWSTITGPLIGTIPNDIFNHFTNMAVGWIGKQNITSNGILFGTSAGNLCNACFNEYDNLWLTPPGTSLGGSTKHVAIYYKLCDSNTIRNVALDAPAGSDVISAAAFDWTALAYWPKANLIDKAEFGNHTVISFGVPSNASGSGAMTHNRITNISNANGQASNPNIPWLQWGGPSFKGYTTLVGGTATVACVGAQAGSMVRADRMAVGGGPIGLIGPGIRSSASFTVESRNVDGTLCTTDTSQVTWEVITDPTY